MAGRPRIYNEIDKDRAREDLVQIACDLYLFPYNDMDEETEEEQEYKKRRPSIREVGRQMGLSEVKVKKLLIDGGFYSTKETRAVARLQRKGKTVEEIGVELDMSVAKVKNLMSYKDTRLYGIGTNSAQRNRVYRAKKDKNEMTDKNEKTEKSEMMSATAQ